MWIKIENPKNLKFNKDITYNETDILHIANLLKETKEFTVERNSIIISEFKRFLEDVEKLKESLGQKKERIDIDIDVILKEIKIFGPLIDDQMN